MSCHLNILRSQQQLDDQRLWNQCIHLKYGAFSIWRITSAITTIHPHRTKSNESTFGCLFFHTFFFLSLYHFAFANVQNLFFPHSLANLMLNVMRQKCMPPLRCTEWHMHNVQKRAKRMTIKRFWLEPKINY